MTGDNRDVHLSPTPKMTDHAKVERVGFSGSGRRKRASATGAAIVGDGERNRFEGNAGSGARESSGQQRRLGLLEDGGSKAEKQTQSRGDEGRLSARDWS